MSTAAPYHRHRDATVDVFRGLAIILVVVGHVIGGLIYSSFVEEKESLQTCYRWIYLFHMPAFFVAAGLFAERSLQKHGVREFVAGKLRTLMYPYVLWGMIMWAVHWLVRRYTHSAFDPYKPLRMIYDPYSGYWFLYVLFVLMLVFALCWRSRMGKAIFLTGAAAGYVIDVVWSELLPSLIGVPLHYAVFFALGVWLAPAVLQFTPKIPSAVLAVGGVAGFAVMTFLPLESGANPFLGFAAAVMGIIGFYGVSGWFTRCGPGTISRFIALCGRHSLEIYLIHPLSSTFARLILDRLVGVSEVIPYIVLCSAAGVIVPLLVVWICQRVGFPYLFTCGKSPRSVAVRPVVSGPRLSLGRTSIDTEGGAP